MEDMRASYSQDPGTQNSNLGTTSIASRRTRRRQKAKWNYRRIAIAVLALVLISTIAIYGGFSLAHKISNRLANKSKVAVKTRRVDSVAKQKPKTAEVKETKAPAYLEYTIKSGDSLYSLALKYHTTVDKIRSLNNISKDNRLQVGMTLKIPTKESEQAGNSPDNQNTQNSQNSQAIQAPDTSTIKPSPKEIISGPTSAKKIALTFDASLGSGVASQVLKALADANVKATFFLSGKWVEDNPELAKKIAEGGNVIGNYTDTHSDLTKLKNDQIVKELKSADDKILNRTGENSKPLFRAPYGARDSRVLKVASDAGYRSIYWTVDSLDWKPSMTPDQVKNRILAGLNNGVIILEHCSSQQSAQILPDLIKEIQSRGYQIVTVPELFSGQ